MLIFNKNNIIKSRAKLLMILETLMSTLKESLKTLINFLKVKRKIKKYRSRMKNNKKSK